jgi:branched-chain amino acid transport system ATP-binding protein
MLTIEGLNTHYGASHVLQGVDLAVPEGRICSVLGRNGVGKTTTLRTIMGLVPPSGGISPAGHRIASRAPASPMCRRGG